MKFKQGGSWNQGTPKIRRNGQWVTAGATGGSSGGGTATGSSFSWDQTHTDTSWLEDAGDDLKVEVVTSADAGELEAACSSDTPSVVVFEAGGMFSGGVTVTGDNTWIAGETAPDPGVICTEGRFNVEADNVIVSHVGSYYGPVGDAEALRFDGDNLLFDHCTAAWGVDETAGASDPHSNVSWIHCIVTEGLYDSVHPEGTHSRGYFQNEGGCRDIAFMGGIMANCNRRMPWGSGDLACVNTHIYNWGESAMKTQGRGNDQDFIGVNFEPGPDSQGGPVFGLGDGNPLYIEDVETNGADLNDGFDIVDSPLNPPPGLDLEGGVVPSADVPAFCRSTAGMRPAARHQVDQGIIGSIGGDNGGIIDDPDEVGGMPNYSEQTRKLDVPSTGLLDWVQGYKRDVEGATSTEEATSTENKTTSDTPN